MKTMRRGFMVLVVLLFVASVAQAVDFAGTSSGTFENPVPQSLASVLTGVGTNHFTWGAANGFGTGPSSLLFTGGPYSGLYETEFKFGTLDYFNGTIAADTGASAVDLVATLAFTLPFGVTENFSFTFQLINTPNSTGTLAGDADYVNLGNAFDPTVFFTDGTTNYYLQFTRFGNVSTTGGFATPGQFHVYEGYSASADLFGKLTATPTNQLPEPTSMLLFGAGMAGLALMRKKFN